MLVQCPSRGRLHSFTMYSCKYYPAKRMLRPKLRIEDSDNSCTLLGVFAKTRWTVSGAKTGLEIIRWLPKILVSGILPVSCQTCWLTKDVEDQESTLYEYMVLPIVNCLSFIYVMLMTDLVRGLCPVLAMPRTLFQVLRYKQNKIKSVTTTFFIIKLEVLT